MENSDFGGEKGSSIIKKCQEICMNRNLIVFNFTVAHIFGIYGILMMLQGKVLLSTVIFALIMADVGGIGVTAGGHRLWAHRSYKAKRPLKILLGICFFFSGQQSLWLWIGMHRVHHKFSDTDADPHNSKRGFFYSHMGWLLLFDHKSILANIKKIDMTDVEREPIIMWHEKYYFFAHLLFVYTIPTLFAWLVLGESFVIAFSVGACFRYIYQSHRTFLVNSAAHVWGTKPYDKTIKPSDNKYVSFLVLGEGWHNYHHVFPWDYRTSELGLYRWNLSTVLIDFFAWIGWAYDLKSVSKETVMARSKRTGDHSHDRHVSWGWGDVDTPKDVPLLAETSYPGVVQ